MRLAARENEEIVANRAIYETRDSVMLPKPFLSIFSVLIAAALTLGMSNKLHAGENKVAINIESSGDDQLTQTLVASLEKRVATSARFALAPNGREEMRWILPGHVYWRDVGKRINFHYVVVIVGPASKFLGTVNGSCWADEMDICSKSIVADISAGPL